MEERDAAIIPDEILQVTRKIIDTLLANAWAA